MVVTKRRADQTRRRTRAGREGRSPALARERRPRRVVRALGRWKVGVTAHRCAPESARWARNRWGERGCARWLLWGGTCLSGDALRRMAVRVEPVSKHTSAASAFRKLSRIVAAAAGDR